MTASQTKIDPQIVEAEENLVIDFQFLVQDVIDMKKISRSELAKRAGITKGRLSQILNAEANPGVRTFARLFQALGVKVEPRIVAKASQIMPLNRAKELSGWHIDSAVESDIAEFQRKDRGKVKAIVKQWLGPCNDNCVPLPSGKAVAA